MTRPTDERLLSMAAKALGYASIDPDRGAEEGPGSFRQALEVFPEELIAFARAVLATEPPAPAPAGHVPDAGNMVAADEEREEREELARWLEFEADNAQELGCATIYDHDRLRWVAGYLRQLATAPAPAADPLPGFAATLIASQRPMDPDVAAALTPEARWEMYDGAPAPAADGEHEELAQWLERIGDDYDDLYRPPSALIRPKLARAAALLREARPQSVPVAERPWERPGWCDAEGQCWWGRCADDFFSPEWTMATLASIEEFCSDSMPQHCLPHWAIPVPANPTETTTTGDQ